MYGRPEWNPRKIIGLVGVDNFKTIDMEFNDSIQGEAKKFFGLMHRNFPITAEFYATEFLFTEFTPMAVQNPTFPINSGGRYFRSNSHVEVALYRLPGRKKISEGNDTSIYLNQQQLYAHRHGGSSQILQPWLCFENDSGL